MVVQIEGGKKVNRTVKHYSLEAIIAVRLNAKTLKKNNANNQAGMYGGI
ncbi:MAG: hypothetical protein ACD_59C00004G0006 [uncultured bacterium]|nr:MAG: hypothetical protein ACD_59C00004G0006 [uncultured bacterium]